MNCSKLISGIQARAIVGGLLDERVKTCALIFECGRYLPAKLAYSLCDARYCLLRMLVFVSLGLHVRFVALGEFVSHLLSALHYRLVLSLCSVLELQLPLGQLGQILFDLVQPPLILFSLAQSPLVRIKPASGCVSKKQGSGGNDYHGKDKK